MPSLHGDALLAASVVLFVPPAGPPAESSCLPAASCGRLATVKWAIAPTARPISVHAYSWIAISSRELGPKTPSAGDVAGERVNKQKALTSYHMTLSFTALEGAARPTAGASHFAVRT